MNVQGFTTDDEPIDGSERLEAVTCRACGRFHLVDPTKGPKPPADEE